MSEAKPKGPRTFIWWFLIVQLVPLVGILALPNVSRVWVLIVFVNTCVLHFNFGRNDTQGYRFYHYLIGGIFGVMAVAWAIFLVVRFYQADTLSV